MIHPIHYNELVNDLIDNRISKDDDIDLVCNVMDLLRYGHNGYINYTNEELIREAMKLKLYGSDVTDIEIIK